MGTNYHYANLTKREWFEADAFGENSKRSGLSYGLSSRALHLLLLGDGSTAATSPINVGRWSSDSITLIGDNDNAWERYNQEFVDIAADVIMLVFAHDGFEPIAEAAERSNHLFMQLCHLVVTQQALSLERHMKEHFGSNFRQRYSDFCKQNRPFFPKNLAFRRTRV